MGFHGRQLGGLMFGHGLALLVAAQGQNQGQGQGIGRDHPEGTAEEVHMALAQQMPGRNAQHKEAAQGPGCQYGVGVHAPGVAVEDHFPEVGKLGPPGGLVDHIAHGMLHEAVGQDDPERGEVARQGHQPDAGAVGLFAQLVPAEMPDGQKGGFQKKGHRGFNGQQRTENVAHIFGVARPVGAELELQGDAGHHAQREVDEKKFAPEFDMAFPDFIAGTHIACFHPGENHGKPQGEGNQNEMEKNGHSELQP